MISNPMQADAMVLASLPGLAFGFALVLARTSGALLLLPGFAEAEVPMTVRAGLAVAVTVLLLPVLQALMPALPGAPLALAGLVVAELLCGLWIGFLARLPLLALSMTGQISSLALGLTSVLQPDPSVAGQTNSFARLLTLAAVVLVLASGLYAWPLSALAGSYRLVPAGALLPASDTTMHAVAAAGAAFALSVRLAAPFLFAGMLWQVATGLAARAVPRLQIYFAAMPGQILGGLLLASLALGSILAAWRSGAQDMLAALPGLG